MKNLVDLTDKNICVTGASSGIGREISILLSKLGAKVMMVARNEERLKSVLNDLEGKDHKIFAFDLSEVELIESRFKNIIDEVGPLNGLVHSAGIGEVRPLKMLKPRHLREVMDINFNSFVEIVRCITKRNAYSPTLSIVGISSVSSLQGNQSKTAYSASKAAMDASIRCMAKELSGRGVRVNSVMPGLIKTEIFESFLEEGADSEDAANVMKRQYMGIGHPGDVANMVAYLLSDAAKFITGASMPIDGGRLTS